MRKAFMMGLLCVPLIILFLMWDRGGESTPGTKSNTPKQSTQHTTPDSAVRSHRAKKDALKGGMPPSFHITSRRTEHEKAASVHASNDDVIRSSIELCASKEYDKALEALHALLEKDMKNYRALEYLADVYHQAGRDEEYVFFMTDMISMYPNDGEMYQVFARYYYELGYPEHAIRVIQSGINLNPYDERLVEVRDEYRMLCGHACPDDPA